MNKKNIIFFMPFIGGGGVEKNLFIISNFISTRFNNVFICTSSIKYKNKFDISFSFISSGICRIKKLNENLIEPDKIETRETSFKNIIRRIVGKLKN